MQIAYLKRLSIEVNHQAIGETFTLQEGNNANVTATLKARTLLSYLWDNGKLPTYSSKEGWCCYCTTEIDNEYAVKSITALLPDLAEDIVAVMPVKYMEESSEQLGVFFVRDREDLQRIFVNSFLDSSRKWLQTHKKEMKELQEAFPVM